MKILVIQLARFGDILQSIPALRALRRKYPEAQIDVLVRERFKKGLWGVEEIDSIVTWDNKKVLGPIYENSDNVDGSLAELDVALNDLAQKAYTNVINISYSPFSSYLTQFLTEKGAQAFGYTRHTDGYFQIPDDASAYFYAQVGVGRPNRLHLTDIFATVLGVGLEAQDFSCPVQIKPKEEVDKQFSYDSSDSIVIHLGASQASKRVSVENWQKIIASLRHRMLGNLVLVGSPEERQLAEDIIGSRSMDDCFNLVGQTSFEDLYSVVGRASLVIGGDSMLMHLAGLTNTPCLNLSFSTVNYWETGPLALESRILLWDRPSDIEPERVVDEAVHQFFGTDSEYPVVIRKDDGNTKYWSPRAGQSDFSWQLIEAIYMGLPYPALTERSQFEALLNMSEVVPVALEQIEAIRKGTNQKVSAQIFERVDEVLETVAKLVPDVFPIYSWFQTERLRITPGPVEVLREKTRKCFSDLSQILSLYILKEDPKSDKELSRED